MDLTKIERNKLDYLLTDLLPAELPELFTYRYFYEYLIKAKKDIDSLNRKVIEQKNNHNKTQLLFESPVWANAPLKYTIMKGLENERVISLLHPVSGIQIFLFISAYQKELLNLLDENAVYSLRYHHRNNELCYKNKNKSITNYFQIEAEKSQRDVLEHTGIFFDIKPYKSIASFTSSEKWMVLNSKYNYFARTDYKACFDSVYTHTYTWIIGKNVTDTKKFKNVNLYATIDRVLMNINSRSSNGIVVGPEFSRMIAELLLQRIDITVYNKLLNDGLVNGMDYNIFRYVDDIFIFAKSEELIDKILTCYSEAARKYLLNLNEQKLTKNKVPFILEQWLKETNLYTNRASTLMFKSKAELREEKQKIKSSEEGETENACLFKAYVFITVKSTLMNHFNNLMCTYSDKCRTIVAYVLGMILNKVSRNKDQVRIFRKNVSPITVFSLIDFVLYIYSFFPDFNNTQKLLGIFSYIRDEFDFTKEDKTQVVFNKYAFIFDKANLNDLANLILFYRQINIEIPFNHECEIVEKLEDEDNPLMWATYLTYSSYNDSYFNEIKGRIEAKIKDKIDTIRNWKEAYIYREFWWIVIFNKCPHLSQSVQAIIDNAISKIGYNATPLDSAPAICNKLFMDYLKCNTSQFYEWDLEKKDLLREITFKTHERSLFKNYGNNLNFMDWTSL